MRFKAKPLRPVLFMPGNKEDWMRKAPRQGLIQAMDESRQLGSAAVTFDGDMVDVAHEETARAMLKMVREWGLVEASP